MISKMKTNRKVMLLALLATGCGERFQLGEVAHELNQSGSGAPALPLLPVLADSVQDADASLERGWMGPGVGDVDGDGFDDWMASALMYGRLRPADGSAGPVGYEGPSFANKDGSDDIWSTFAKAGDINGDGYGDILVSTYVDLLHRYEFENGEYAAETAENRATTARRWAEQRGFLWYGGPDRKAGRLELADVAVGLPSSEAFPRLFERELTERHNLEEVEYRAAQSIRMTPLGDIDGDGFDDLAWTVTFSWYASREEQHIDSLELIRTRERTESVTQLVYGRADQLASNPTPAARLPGVYTLQGIGDVNGDGYADVQALSGNVTRVIAGRAERLEGELSIDQVSVPMVGALPYPAAPVGDLDQDGYDDFFPMWETDSDGKRYPLFYGSPSLLDAPLDKSAAGALFAIQGPISSIPGAGDWNGDGFSDIVFQNARIVTDQFSDFAGNEVRLLPGGPERYSGEHEVSVNRPDATIDEDNLSSAMVVGDIDGDGLADLFLGSGAQGPGRYRVKYGAPLATTVPIR